MKIGIVLFCLCLTAGTLQAAERPTFRDALRLMEQRDLDIQTKKTQLARAEAQRLGAAANFLPTLSLQAIDDQRERPTFNRMQSGALAGQVNLFHSGADVAAWRAGQSALRRERYQLSQTELDSEQQNLAALVLYIQTAQQLKVAENLSRLNQELARVVDARYKKGLIPLQDAQKAVIEKNNSAARLQDAQARFEQARAALENRLGLSDIQPQWPWKEILVPSAAERWSTKQLDLVSTPAWQVALEASETQAALERARLRDYLPTLDLNVGYGYQSYLTEKRPGWETKLVLTVPLFDLKKASAYRVSLQETALARLNQEKVRRALLSSWQETKAKLMLALHSAQSREESVKMAQSLYQDNERRAKAGRSSLNDIVVDQNRLSDAENLAVEGWAQAHLLYAQMCHSLGLRVGVEKFDCVSN